MKLTEQQLIELIRESAMKVINEIGYHEKQKREQSDEEHAEWIKKKSEAKKRELERQRREKGDDKSDSKAIDYYDYKHGKGNFPVMKEDLFVPFRKSPSEEVISVDPTTLHVVIGKIKNGKFDALIQSAGDEIHNYEWAGKHIDVSAQNMDTASDIYYTIREVLEQRAQELNSIQQESIIRLSSSDFHKFLKESVKRVIKEMNETTLDYDMDNFSGKWSRGTRYDIIADGDVYYHDVSENEVDELYRLLSLKPWIGNIEVKEI